MNDRELLELAAKAAGLEWENVLRDDGAFLHEGREWNPLMNNRDAFHLQVELDMNVFQVSNSAYALPSYDNNYSMQASHGDCGGKQAATRRAIVLAAAEVGKQMDLPTAEK